MEIYIYEPVYVNGKYIDKKINKKNFGTICKNCVYVKCSCNENTYNDSASFVRHFKNKGHIKWLLEKSLNNQNNKQKEYTNVLKTKKDIVQEYIDNNVINSQNIGRYIKKVCEQRNIELLKGLLNLNKTFTKYKNKKTYKDNLNYRDSYGSTALMDCSYGSTYLDFVKILLEEGADPNIKDQISYTALNNAIISNNIYCVRLLLKYGANPYIKYHEDDNCNSYYEPKILNIMKNMHIVILLNDY